MSTAEAVEGMTDAGQFEILATRSLRELDEDCRAVAHFGVNEEGKTIANPVDGFCRVPGSDPPCFVLPAFTLTAREGLERKWLFDHSTAPRAKTATAADDGDLMKAAREAAAIRATHPTAKFIVYLCTNRRLDTDLMRQVYDKAAQVGVEVRFLDQSRLRDFLDANSVGQWLRQEHLRIQADQVSEPFLRHISRPSVERHAAELLLTSVDQIVPTAAADRAAAAARDPAVALHLLVGASGAGKSVIGQDLLRRHTAQGGAGLWIPGEVVEAAASLAEAVERVLCSLHPRIGLGAGQAAVRLPTPDHPLLLLIDDINRSDHPARLLQKLIAWSRPPAPSGGQAQAARNAVRIVCPVWDSYWMPLQHLYESLGWIRIQGVGSMNRPEAVACLRLSLGEHAGRMTHDELDGFAERLGDDPILLALFGRMLRDAPETNPFILAEDVIGRLVGKSVGEVAAHHSRPHQHYAVALTRVSQEMIRRKVLYPTWADLGTWLRGEQASFDAVGQLAAQGHVCRLTERGGASRFEFRHDRILEHQLAAATAEMVCREGGDRDAVSDPFFTSIQGRAIARFALSEPILDWVMIHCPNGLIAAISYLPTSASAYADMVVAKARAWLSQAGSAPVSRRWEAVRTLAESRSRRVLEATEGVPENIWLLEARLRNGDALAGSRALVLSRKFFPAVRYAWLETLIEQAKAHHGLRLIADLQSLLTADGQDDNIRSGALCLAGYLGDPCLADAVRTGWDRASDRRAVLLPALWAGLRCSGEAVAEVLGRMMPVILELPHEKGQHGFSERGSLLRELGFATRHGVGGPVLSYLANLGKRDEKYRRIVAALLDDIDHPLAIGYVVPELAAAQHRAEQGGGFSPRADTWEDRWRRRGEEGASPLSDSSLAELRRMWDNDDSPDWLKDYAFRLWARYVSELAALRCILSTSPHFEEAVWQRALRGDKEVVPHVLMKLADRRRWLHVVAPIWSPEFEPVIDAFLGEVRTKPELQQHPWAEAHFMLAHLLRDITLAAAERLLTKHWDSLKRIPLFIQTALYVGTDRCQALAAEAVSQAEDPFQHIDDLFGFFTSGLMDRLTARHLDVLRPYLSRLPDHCLADMTEFCRRCGHWEWGLQHLGPECRRLAQASKPKADGHPSFIVRVTQHWFPTDEELLGELDQIERVDPRYHTGRIGAWWEHSIKRGDHPGRPPRLLGRWFHQSPSFTRFKVVALALSGRGTRQDLAILRNQRVDAAPGEVEAIVADTEFAVMRRSLD